MKEDVCAQFFDNKSVVRHASVLLFGLVDNERAAWKLDALSRENQVAVE
jgi:hypothetical protein